MNVRLDLPVNVGNRSDGGEIAELFKEHLSAKSLLGVGASVRQRLGAGAGGGTCITSFTA